MKLIINKDRSVIPVGTWGTKNENNYEILDFEFPEELENYNKRIVYYLDDKRVWDAIINNKAILTNAITTKGTVKAYVWLTLSETITLKYVCDGTEEGNYYFTYDNTNHYFTMPEVAENDELIYDVATNKLKLGNTEIATTTTGTGTELTFNTIIDAEEDFRTQLFEMNFYENENADGIVPTPEQVDGFNTMLTAMNNKIDEVDALEQTIEAAETERQDAENTRASNEVTRESNEATRQSNEQTRQSQEAERERRTDEAIGNIEDKTAEYNANAKAKTNAFNNNATQKTNEFNANYTQKVNDFNSNATSKTNDFNSNASGKTTTFNNNASSKTSDFNTNATNKTNAFDSNASSKTTTFNNNASSKTTAFNENATSKTNTFNSNAESKTNTFNDNATQKTTDFNNNAQAKTEAFDEHTAEITADIEELQQEVEELSENMPWNTTEQATEISVDDAAKYSKNKLELFGNTEQDNTKKTYKCDGTETGDYYLTYDSTDYYFTMPTITEGDILVFDTTDLKLYLGDTEITTESTGTGTNLTFIASPNPNFPQDIHVVTGNNTISVGNTNYPINLGSIELCKIGDYQDYLYKENGNWYKYGAIEKLVLDGTETNWNKANSIMEGTTRFYRDYNKIINGGNETTNTNIYVASNYFKATYWYDIYNINTTNMNLISNINNASSSVKRIVIRIDNNKASEVTTFKEWLSENNTTVYYVCATPTSTQITDETLIEQLEAIYNHLALVKGINHITITPSDLEPYVTLSYMQDLPSKLDNLDSRLALLE